MKPQVVLITGASSGIGLEAARLLSERGHTVFGTSRNPRPDPIRGFELLPLEVGSQASVKACVASVLERAGRVDVLVNNVGNGIAGAIEETTVEEAQGVMDINFWSAVRMTGAVLPSMRQQHHGKIISLSSAGGFAGIPFRGFYVASKFALEGYSESLRYEVRPFGIHVSLIEPTSVKTPAGDRVPDASNPLEVYAPQRQPFTENFNRSMRNGMLASVVANAVLHIVESRAPRLRYRVGAQANMLHLLRRAMPQSAFERFIRAAFKV